MSSSAVSFLEVVFNHVIRRLCWSTKQSQMMARVLHSNGVKLPNDFFFRFCSVHQPDGDDIR